MKSYDFKTIEDKWRKIIEDNKVFNISEVSSDNNFYCLDMFPYPSGKGLHVGHWRGYTLSDYYAKFHRLNGKNVLHPMGFDSFGLPAENAAIKNKSHPKQFIDQAIKVFETQLDQMSSSYDWNRKIVTSDPEYYRWTQWLFLQLYKHGFVEKRTSLVNWCPNDQTVLANEQVQDGLCERCGSKVSKKELAQWHILTTKYSEELLNELSNLDWPERVKSLQRNWIGKSDGSEVVFKLEDKSTEIRVFTTRLDTIFGVTALVLAPEHPLVSKLITNNKKDFERYLNEVSSKTNIDRQQSKESEKTAFFTGRYAIHPITNEKLPIWLADYVLLEYGTGAVMSVPAHDERDYEFAHTHNLPIKEVVTSPDKINLPFIKPGVVINSDKYNGLTSEAASAMILSDLSEKKLAQSVTLYRLRDWLVSRQRYWGAPIPIVYDPSGKPFPVDEKHLPLLLPEDVDFLPGGESPIARSKKYKLLSENLYGKGWQFETDTLDTFFDSSWYYLRYLNPKNNQVAFEFDLVKKWLPVDLYVGGIEHATLHLLYARFITRFLSDFNYIPSEIKEPFKKLFSIGLITLHGDKMSKSKGNDVSPDHLIEHYGTDALRGYELFIGPADVEAEWNPRGINGVFKYLIKLNQLKDKIVTDSKESEVIFNRYLENIEPMIDDFKLNTIVAESMKALNDFEKTGLTQEVYLRYIITLYPIFPFITSELYQELTTDQLIFNSNWPKKFDISSQKRLQLILQLGKKAVYLGSFNDSGLDDSQLKDYINQNYKNKLNSNDSYLLKRIDDRVIIYYV